MFEVDHKGLAKLVANRGKEFILFELWQNAADEDGVTFIDVNLTSVPNSPYVILRVEDDSPQGFHDLAHAYTLFAESRKKSDATKRGRFNLGEKLVLALFEEATISTTTGEVRFARGQRSNHPKRKRERGTVFEGRIRMTREEQARVTEAVKRLIVPDGITFTFNGERITAPMPMHSFDITLPTVLSDDEGNMRPTRRKTTVTLYAGGGHIYEMGIPVVECDLPVRVNVMQKVPLNLDRDNVTPSYLKEISAHVLNHLAHSLTEDQASASWVNKAIEHKDIRPHAVNAVLDKRYGEKRVVFDPTDPEGSKLAMSKGYTVIPGRAFSREAWTNIRATRTTLPAGQVTPSPKPYSDDPNAPVRKDYTGEVTPAMQAIIDLTKKLASEVMAVDLDVVLIADFAVPASATYGRISARHAQFEYNVNRLGKAWFEQEPTSEKVLDLMIHEFGHQYSSDHLSSEYYKALTRLGAQFARLALTNPDAFKVPVHA